MKFKSAFIFSTMLVLFGFNLDHRAPARAEINYFKKNMQDHIHTYQGEYRKMTYAENGDNTKRPVILIHGAPGSKEDWYSYLLDKELLKNYHLLAVDRPGYEGSDKGHSERSVEKQAADIWKILEANKSGLDPIVVGYSYAGSVATKIAMMHPNEVQGLVILSGEVNPALESDSLLQKIAKLWGIRDIIPSSLRVANEESLALKLSLEQMLPEWSNINARVHVIHGDQDKIVSIKSVDFIKSKIEVEKTTIVPGMDHFIIWYRPDVVKDSILSLGK